MRAEPRPIEKVERLGNDRGAQNAASIFFASAAIGAAMMLT